MTRQVVAAVDPISTLVAEMAATEVEHARESQEGAEATYRATRWRVLGIAATAALVWLVISLLLIRNIVPRVRAYSGFAAGVADGSRPGSSAFAGPTSWPSSGTPSTRWSGAAARSVATRSPRPSSPTPCSSARPSARRTSSSERHLERSIDGSQVTVLNRNNSADRLEAATPVGPECPLAGSFRARSRGRAWRCGSGAATGAAGTAVPLLSAASAGRWRTPSPASRSGQR